MRVIAQLKEGQIYRVMDSVARYEGRVHNDLHLFEDPFGVQIHLTDAGVLDYWDSGNLELCKDEEG